MKQFKEHTYMRKIERAITAMLFRYFRSNADKWILAVAASLFIANLVAGLIWPRV